MIHVVPHTHWDREWYLPFQRFRVRLVELLDDVLDALESDPRFAFTLDGQLAIIDDYLEVRPEGKARLRRLVGEGRLSIGPWYILMDEFLVSGETIVRNLELGRRRGEELGGVMCVGYLPDMFGHIAQMPQLLSRAGITDAVVWRGVPASIDRHAFRWEAPDGSAVRAEYLVGGYGNAAYLFDDPDRLAAGVERFHERMRPTFGEDEPLAMVGTDHMLPPPDLVVQVDRLNESQDRYRLQLGTLAEFMARPGTDDDLPRCRGELRSAARANMLMGVTSSRIDLKAACARAERVLERYAEPFAALYGRAWPDDLLRLAWRRVIENSAHDSICGCSADSVCDQVLVRFAEAEQIGSEIALRVAEAVAAGVPVGGVVVLNPSPHERTGLVEFELELPHDWTDVALALPDGSLLATQESPPPGAILFSASLPGERVTETLAQMLHGRELFGLNLNGATTDDRVVVLNVGRDPDPPVLDVYALLDEIARATAAGPDGLWELRIVRRPLRRLQATVPVPALGWTSVRAVPGVGTVENSVGVDATGIRNGLIEVDVGADGTLALAGLEGIGRLVDGGDHGDTYNYAPPLRDTLVGEPETVAVDVRSSGPVRGELAIVRTYRWPVAGLEDGSGRSEETALVPVTTHVELRAGEPFVRVRISLENPSRDHRLRFQIPLAAPVTGSFAEGQFAVVERGLETEGGHGEVPLATYPARGFVAAGGIAVLLEHVLEYELVGGRELALTILRCTGLISRSANRYREEPAGPELPVPGAQCVGPWSVAFALYPYDDSWVQSDVLIQMERHQHPLLTAPATGAAAASPVAGTFAPHGIALSGPGVVLSSLRRRDEWLELRLVCEQPEPRRAVVSGSFREAREVDLMGRPGRALPVEGGALTIELGAWAIATVQLAQAFD